MYIQEINDTAFSVYITDAELKNRGISPDSVSSEQVLELLSAAMGSAPESAQVDLFPGKNEMMIFVRRARGEPEFWFFSDFESLLGACYVCPDVPSSLYSHNSGYYLTVCGADDMSFLSEFGEQIDADAAFLYYLREHGRVICENGAVSAIKNAFIAAKKGNGVF